MRIFKIKNRKLFYPQKYNAKEQRYYTREERKNFSDISHFYAAYFDRKTKSYKLVPLTHLYEKDNSKFKQLQSKELIKEKFSFSEVPSGVKNYYIFTDREGKKINVNDSGFVPVSSRHIGRKQADRIKNFAKNKGQ